MIKKIQVIIACAVLITVTLACQLANSQATQAPASTPVNEEVFVEENTPEIAEPTEDLQATEQAAQMSTQAAEEEIQASMQAAEQATVEAVAEAATAEAGIALTQAAEVDYEATAQVQGIVDAVELLASEGVIEKTAGTYYQIEDFNESWAQIGWYQWWGTDLAPTDFVLRAHTEWESASRTANWFESGCGFVFREEDANNHYMIYLALDGNVYLKGYLEGQYKEYGKGYVGKLDFMKGGADVMLVVEGDHILYYINGEKILDRQNSALREGNLALTLVSGTNKDYGTRCDITDIELWDMTQ